MNKKIRSIIIISIMVLIVLTGALIYTFYTNVELIESETTLEYIKNDDWNEEAYPDGMPKLYRSYSGSLTAKNMGKSIYYVTTKVIPKYYTELKSATEAEIAEYYNKYAKIINIDIGIGKQQDFVDLIKSIQNLSADELKFESFRIDKEKISKKNSYTEAVLYITYQNNEEIGFNVRIYNSIKQDVSTLTYTAL